MRDRVVRGGAIAAAGLMVFAAACSSSGSGTPRAGGNSTIPTVTAPRGGSATLGSGSTSSTGRPGSTITNPNTGDTILDPTTKSAATYPTSPPTTQPPVATTSTTSGPPYTLQWQFAADFRSHPGANPFADYLGGPKQWSVRQSQSLSRNGNYELLPHYAATFGSSGVSGWYGDAGGCVGRPSAAANTVNAPATVCGADIRGHLAFVYPGQSHMAVVAWTSLFDGNIRIAAAIADLDPKCGDGVRYYIDKGTQNLSAITLVNANAVQLDPITTSVTFGQSIYFIVDAGAKGNNDCDTTQLSIIINRLQG